MGFMDKVKGFLNVGGPKVSITNVEQPILGKFGVVSGTVRVETKRPAKIVKLSQRFVLETTTGKGEEKKTERKIIAERDQELDIDLKDNEHIELMLHISYDSASLVERMAESGGVLGALGKAGQLAGKFGAKGLEDYYVEASVDVVGTPLDPSDRIPVRANLND